MNLISRRKNVWKSSAVFFHFCSLLHSTLLIICVVDCIGCHESISKILFVVTLNENATENKAARCFFWILLQYSRRIQAKGGEVRHPPYSALIHPSNLRYFLRIHLSFLYGSAILVSYPQSFYATTIKICWHYKYQAQLNSSDPRIKSRIWRIEPFISGKRQYSETSFYCISPIFTVAFIIEIRE